jgi:hypothetical protein
VEVSLMTQRSLLSLACFAAAGAWPSLVTALERALMSPLQRAIRDAICGSPFHAGFELLGHCAACWAGSAILVATGLIVLVSSSARTPPARVRSSAITRP